VPLKRNSLGPHGGLEKEVFFFKPARAFFHRIFWRAPSLARRILEPQKWKDLACIIPKKSTEWHGGG
jgi:hypothetical protein